jgi:branched-chain amino acid aminotransferase
MPVKKTDKIWHNGKMIGWDDAQIHVLSHVVSYASGVFEGVRCYKTPRGPAVFRLRDHMQRLIRSAHIYRMDIPFPLDSLVNAVLDLVRVNRMESCYIRPIVLRGYGEMGVDPFGCPVETYLACWEWGAYLGAEAINEGVDVCVSSWRRPAPDTLPQLAKAAPNYMNSQLVRMEAISNGYAEGITLDTQGLVAEGSGENIFVAFDGRLWTPPLAFSLLPGITRSSIITLCQDFDIPLVEQPIPREMLYVADEVFFCGTAAEVTPIRSVDKVKVGCGRRGPITERLQKEFFAITQGTKPDRHGWLTPVNAAVTASR